MAAPAAPATLRQRYRRWPVAPGTCGQKPASLSHLPTVPGPLEATAPLDGGDLRGICGPERCLPTAGDGRALAHLETGAAAVRVCATVVSGSGGVRKSLGSTMLLRKQRGQTAGFGCDLLCGQRAGSAVPGMRVTSRQAGPRGAARLQAAWSWSCAGKWHLALVINASFLFSPAHHLALNVKWQLWPSASFLLSPAHSIWSPQR